MSILHRNQNQNLSQPPAELLPKQNESNEEYKNRLCTQKELFGLTWREIADLYNEATNEDNSPDAIRKYYSRNSNNIQDEKLEEITENLVKVQKERYKARDERSEANALIRRISREETLKEIADELIRQKSFKNKLEYNPEKVIVSKQNKQATLLLSDWHYGLVTDNYHNKYNPEIAEHRLNKLLNEVIEIIKKENIYQINVLNLGDLISGNIHLPLRITNRTDVISQTLEVEGLLSEFLFNICKNVDSVKYGSVTDNHSRLDPNKKESLQLESFVRVIDWALKKDLKDCKNIEFIDNEYGDDIVSCKIFDHKLVGVHGDRDNPNNIISNLSLYTHEHYDIIVSAHMHHFSADELNYTISYCNGSMMGEDDYAQKLRRSSSPSQLMIISTPECVDKCIYKIRLD